jgi:fatty acid desaturase
MGLGSAEWYRSPIPRKQLKELMQRSDGPAIRDTAIWLGAMAASGIAGYFAWGTWWAVPCFLVYGVLYGSRPIRAGTSAATAPPSRRRG